MEFKINRNSINTVVEEEISRVASRTYTDNGEALYDKIRIISRDAATIERLLTDVTNTLLSRFRILVSLEDNDKDKIIFNLPDLSEHFEDRIETVLDRYLSMGVVGKWLQELGNAEAAMYLERANASINEAELLMLTRMPVKRRER